MHQVRKIDAFQSLTSRLNILLKRCLPLMVLIFPIVSFGEYKHFSTSDDGGQSIYYDIGTLEYMGKDASKLRIMSYVNVNFENISYESYSEISCLDKSFRTLNLKEYPQLNIKGNPVIIMVDTNRKDFAPPNTLMRGLIDIICP